MPQGGGKEELRASILKPYLLRLRAEKGDKAVRALLATAGLPPSILDNETAWISVAAARRALSALEGALSREGIARRGSWMTHPENLGTYVRLLRSAGQPMDPPAPPPAVPQAPPAVVAPEPAKQLVAEQPVEPRYRFPIASVATRSRIERSSRPRQRLRAAA